jgi:hypothetical protein
MFSRNIWSFKPADPANRIEVHIKARSVKLDARPPLETPIRGNGADSPTDGGFGPSFSRLPMENFNEFAGSSCTGYFFPGAMRSKRVFAINRVV